MANFSHIRRQKFEHFSINPLVRDYYYIIDNYSTISCGHSLRKLSSTATKCIRVRRSSDNAETDVYFANNVLDVGGMVGWSGADSVYVTTWYNQYDSNHLIQTTNANQPRIVNAGTVDTDNGFPAIYFDGTNYRMEWTSDLSVLIKTSIILLTPSATITTATAQQRIFNGNDGTTQTVMGFGSISANLTNERLSFLTVVGGSVYGNGYTSADISGQKIIAFSSDGNTNGDIFMNGVSLSLSASTAGGFTSAREPQIIRYLGSSTTGTNLFSGYIKEVIIDSYNANLVGINGNINSYYSVY